jgi:signal transduction histidine kinase/CheY-like chemotaxis protein
MRKQKFKTFTYLGLSILFLLLSVPVGVEGSSTQDSANRLLEASTNEQKLDLLLTFSNNLKAKSPKEAIEYGNMAIVLAANLNKTDKLAKVQVILAKAHYVLGSYDVALDWIMKAEDYYLAMADSLGTAETYQVLGQIYTRIGNFKLALDYTQNAFSILGRLGQKERLSELVRETGNIYFYFGEKAIALDFYQKSLKLSEETNDFAGIAKAYNNMGRIYSELERYDLALECLKKSLSHKNKTEDPLGYANTLLNLGTVYFHKNDLEQALTFFQEANQLFTNVGNPEGMANSMYYIGRTYYIKKQSNQALAVLEEAYGIASGTRSNTLLVNISKSLSQVYADRGDYKAAYNFFQNYNVLRDSVFSDEKRKLLVELEAKYQIQSKQKQIELLTKDKLLKQSEKNQSRFVIALLGSFILLLLSLTYTIYGRFRYKSKANVKLLEEISQRKLAEARLQEHHLKLEGLVEDRTRDLKLAKERAEESDRLKTAFLANMSHEIRTPMNAIVGFSYLLTDPESTEEAKTEYTKIIRSNGEVLMNIINDILDISLIEAGQLKTKIKQVQVVDILDDVLLHFEKEKERLKKDHVQFVKDFEKIPLTLTLNTDKIRLSQVISNLVSNALKYTDTGSITVGLRLNDLNEVLFYVKDTGIGIAPEKHKQIFERFNKVHSENENKLYSGTGLGLAICSELVKHLGGKIWLDSYPGRGSTFYFTIPNIASPIQQTVQVAPDTSKINEKLVGKTILIAEDVATNYQLIQAFLASSKVNLLWAQNGAEAVDIFNRNKNIDIILMDIQMPVMDGLRALQKIRKVDKKIPVIINTAFYLNDEMEKSYAAGCSDYMTKPIRKEELLLKLSNFLS